ncbi:MAG: methionine synthase [Fibrobacter sp.]|nr:methionine synthase [Fibrobacter sp.]
MPVKNSFIELQKLISQRIAIIDGATGTMIQAHKFSESVFRGKRFANHPVDLKGNNDILSVTFPDAIYEIHNQYLQSGADIIKTNTFNATAISQSDYNLQDICYELNVASAQIARKAADTYMAAHPDNPKFVAGDLGPTNRTLSISPDVNNPGYRNITFQELTDAYYDSARGLLDGGADLFLIETVFDTLNAKAAIFAIMKLFEERSVSLPVMISGTITDRSGRTLSGQTPAAFYHSVKHAPLLSIGLNCALGASQIKPFLKELSDIASIPVSVHPNAGLPNAFGGYDETAESMAAIIREFALEGMINLAGGCCGTTPAHIKAISESLAGIVPRQLQARKSTTVLCGLQPLTIDETSLFINIGERTNVAGSAKFKKLIANGEYEAALEIAHDQVQGGAQIIDVNMDDAMIDSKLAMQSFLNMVASEPEICTVPVMIDSSKWEVIESGLRCVQGKAIVNSISLKEGEDLFLQRARQIQRYGAAIVVMAFDEKGQADTLERKISICKRAYDILTRKGGIDPSDIIFDPNIFSIGTGIDEHKNYAVDYFKATAWIKSNLPCALVCGGVSNVSFSFRGNQTVREAINSAFLYHAIKAGMDMGIVNPTQLAVYEEIPLELREKVEDVIFNRRDDSTENLLDFASTVISGESKTTEKDLRWREFTVEERLQHALVKGITEYLEQDLTETLETIPDPVQLIEGPLMNGMNIVGDYFGSGRMFLPQVVKSARVMRKAVSFLTPLVTARKPQNEISSKTKILLATVKGDVHDIGKNIVAVVLQCNNYEVIDMGVMVPCKDILDKAEKEQVQIIGLSGLITPSLEEMSYVASEMEKRSMKIPLLIGGATTSKVHTAVKIAPNYSGPVIHVRDASLAVQLCRKVLSDDQRDFFLQELSDEYSQLRDKHAANDQKKEILSLQQARNNKFTFDYHLYQPVKPAKQGITIFSQYSLNELSRYIDWTFFFKAWELKGQYPYILNDATEGEQARKLLDDAHAMLSRIINENLLEAKGVIGLFPANSNGEDDIKVYSPENDSCIATIHCLRQQLNKITGKPNVCLSDFLLPQTGNKKDYMGFFAVTAGIGVDRLVEEFEKSSDTYSSLMVKILADRLSEAFAERLHELVRTTYWGYSPDENLEVKDLLHVKYRGIRPAPGYPACPDHSEKETIFSILDVAATIGVSLTDSFMMQPAASVCGYYFAHPQSHYFSLGKIGDNQLIDYASRKGVDRKTIQKWIAPFL